MKRNDTNTLLMVGGIAGAFLLVKGLGGGIKSLFTGLAESLNIRESATEQASAQQYANEPRVNAWNPNYWDLLRNNNPGKKVQILSVSSTNKIVKDLYDSIYQMVPVAPDTEKILGTFSLLKYKSQVSWVASAFQKKYNKDLLTFLDNGSPFFIGNTGLPDQSMRKLLTYVEQLPNGLIK